MNCDILKIVRGNDFATQMTITALDAGGNVIEDFSLENSTDVVVKYTLAGESHTIEAYDYDIEGNDITIQWSDLALGKYGFEIEGKFNGYSWRSAARFIFQIVADNASANIPDGVLVDGVYKLSDWLRLLSGTGGGGKQVQANWTETDTNSPAYIQNKPNLAPVATSGSYNDLTDKPNIPAAQIQSDWDQTDTSAKDYIKNKPTIPSVTDKADKVSGAVAGDFAALDSNGNLTDSGKKASDFATAEQGAKADTAIQDISGKQDVLVSGTNIKTINNESILGSGNITIEGGGDVESVNGKVGVVVLNAEDVGAYEKPASGIPSSDMSQSVQSALSEVDAFINGKVIIVTDHTSVVSPQQGFVYREPSADSYTDWGWNGSEWENLATYNGGFIACFDDDSLAQLNIGDKNGYVIAQFKDGHFRTKLFDSRLCADYSDGGHQYVGEKIDVRRYSYSYALLFTETNSSASANQGSTCYGKYLFQFHNTHDTIDIFDMENGNKVQTITLSAVSTYHCNNANFGNEFYDSSDYFPLLYVSQENVDVHTCLVYRVTGTEGEWGLTLVQTITFPTPSNDFMWYPNVMIDKTNDKFIAAGLGNNPWSSGTDNIIRYKVFPMPKLSDGDITLNVADIENSVELKYYPTTQGGFALNNKVYQVFGSGSNAKLLVTDLNAKRVVSEIDITADGIQIEPEGCFVYDNTICVNFIDGKVYRFNF